MEISEAGRANHCSKPRRRRRRVEVRGKRRVWERVRKSAEMRDGEFEISVVPLEECRVFPSQVMSWARQPR